jgi:DNA-binding helix-hairpin-helix protein with protein kinase domain
MDWTLARDRTKIALGQELGRGGEGAVFALPGRPAEVAKVYLAPPAPAKLDKLTAMAATASPAIVKIAAWPTDLLLDSRGVAKGFVMPRLTSRRDLHELYSPKSRFEAFPEADFRFLVHVAANVARAFTVVHEQGHVIGDVNHGNVLVSPDGTVMLIDCDSFQIRAGDRWFPCDVGVPLFTPPELQGRSFRGLHRTVEHDRFGLAVLLFHLLFMGRHPFAGRFSGAGDMPIERAITEHRFAYGPDRKSYGMERPPGALPLETLGTALSSLLIRAFGPDGSRGRPAATDWIEALVHLENGLRPCAQARWHHIPAEAAACPWCVVERQTGLRLFGQRIQVLGPGATIDLAALWQAIAAVPDPGADPTLPSDLPWSPPADLALPPTWRKSIRAMASLGCLVLGLGTCAVYAGEALSLVGFLLFLLTFPVWPRVPAERRAEADRELAAARAKWDAARAHWHRQAGRERFVQQRRSLDQARAELADLPNERRRRMAGLEARRDALQRQRYLDRFRIDRAKIRGIGPGRTAMLAAYGVETAADVDPVTILRIPGFGEGLAEELVAWRRQHEANYRFNPQAPVDPHDIAELDRDLTARRQALITLLRRGPGELARLGQEIAATRQRLMPSLEATWSELKIAELRRKAL